jgi:two-component system sensor histidine kinase CpxA
MTMFTKPALARLFNPHSIYWKIFLSFWLSMLLILIAAAAVTTLLIGNSNQQLRLAVDEHLSAGRTVYEFGGETALRNWLAQQDAGPRPFWLDQNNEDILDRPLPRVIRRELRGQDSQARYFDFRRPFISDITMSDGITYRVVTFPKLKRSHKRWNIHGGAYFPWIMLAIAIIVTGLISYLLVRRNIDPLRSLRETSHRISAGELNARVEPAISRRKDEIGLLGSDFNTMAEQLESMLSSQRRMLRDISHELRSPLARLRVALELARRKSGGNIEKEHQRIELESERLDQLIEQILSLVRLESYTEISDRTSIELHEVLAVVVEDADFEARAKNRHVQLFVEHPCQINADEILIRSLFENIVRNAISYTEDGSTVSVKLQRGALGYSEIRIEDHGPGVAEQLVGDIFKPFYRVGDARDRASGGHGLGLAIAARIVQLHSGFISAQNLENGFVVSVVLPVETD